MILIERIRPTLGKRNHFVEAPNLDWKPPLPFWMHSRTAIDNEDTLVFSVLENICPMIETVRLEQAADGCARMMQGKARFHMVLVAKEAVAPGAPLN